MNGLGACIGTIGMIPCCPFPNPFKSVGECFARFAKGALLMP
jgi:hypothetical protein